MGLSDEQNAMLRLLASGEQGYEDIAALMGLSVEEVRAKVVGALAQLEAEGKPAPDIPPPRPSGAAPAGEPVPFEPEPAPQEPAAAPDAEPAPDKSTPEPAAQEPAAAQEPEPAAEEPVTPIAAPAAVPRTPPPPAGRPPGGRTITLPSGRGAWIFGGAILAAIVVVVIVLILGPGGGSSTGSTQASSSSGGEGKAGSKEATKAPTEAKLKAVDGSEATGLATFGRYKKTLALQVEASGLEATTKGTDSYTIWLAQSPQKMLPLAFPVEVKASGKFAHKIAAQFEVPVEILAYLAQGTFDQIAITRTANKQFETSVNVAKKKKQAPTYTGEPVLRGTITGPIVGLAAREEAEKEQGKKAE